MRKVRTGTVVRTKSDKTTIVEMVWKQRHRLYRKQMRRVARFYVHDPLSQCQLGDIVRIQETRPISKTKRWRLMEILERHLVAEVRPIELEADADVILAPESEAGTEEMVDESASEEESDDDEAEEEDESQEESEEDEPEAADEVEEEPTAEEEQE
jgi:small subunit ribosomal protein S17